MSRTDPTTIEGLAVRLKYIDFNQLYEVRMYIHR